MAIDISNDPVFSAIAANQSSARASVANAALSGGVALMDKQNYTGAAKAFQQAVSLQPDNVDAYNLLAQAYAQLGKRKEAAQAYTNAINLMKKQTPDQSGKTQSQQNDTLNQIYTNLANIYIDDKKYSAAEQALKAASRAKTSDPLSHYTLAQVYVLDGKLADAQEEFKKTIRLSPNDGNPYYGLGTVLNKMGKYDDAIKQLQKATQLKADFTPAIFEMGKSYVALGQEDQAQVQIDTLKKLVSRYSSSQNTSELQIAADAQASVDDLSVMIEHPKMQNFGVSGSFQTTFSTVPLAALGVELVKPGASQDFTVTFQFNSDMDAASVMNITNWSITKARGGTAGLYDNGLYRPTDVQVPFMPKRVSFDPGTSTATLVFSLSQNADGTGTVDPKHIVFKFMGTDVNGKKMDATADEYEGFVGLPF